MVQAPVECPQCKKVFNIPIVTKKGVCPQCHASLIFERVNPQKATKSSGYYTENIEKEKFREVIDEIIHEKSQETHPPRVQDIAVISTFGPPRQFSHLKKSVDRLLRTRG